MRNLLLAVLLALVAQATPAAVPDADWVWPVSAVDSVSLTVSDMASAVEFYTRVLTFEKVADREVAGDEYEHLFGVFGLRVRAVRLRLGHEYLELLQFLAPRGRPFPVDSRSNDRWFQHEHVETLSAEFVRLPGSPLGWGSGILAHDPDGHASLIAATDRAILK